MALMEKSRRARSSSITSPKATSGLRESGWYASARWVVISNFWSPFRQAMVPNRFPWVHTASAQPDTIASMASGRASVVKSRSRSSPATTSAGSATRASRTEPPTKYRV